MGIEFEIFLKFWAGLFAVKSDEYTCRIKGLAETIMFASSTKARTLDRLVDRLRYALKDFR